jgi:hypothetical protein
MSLADGLREFFDEVRRKSEIRHAVAYSILRYREKNIPSGILNICYDDFVRLRHYFVKERGEIETDAFILSLYDLPYIEH